MTKQNDTLADWPSEFEILLLWEFKLIKKPVQMNGLFH
jgi:hypothetical protein